MRRSIGEQVVVVTGASSGIGLATAKAAGVRSIAVTWGFRPRERLAGADALADSPAQLAALLR